MKKATQKIQVEIRFKGLDLIQSSLDLPPRKIGPSEEYLFNVELNHQFNIENEEVLVFVRTKVQLNDFDRVLGRVTNVCKFQVNNLGSFAKEKDGKPGFPTDLLDTLNEIAIHTSRGVIFMQFRGTHLHHATLPLIQVGDLKPENS
jgi:hypothetical protein